MIQIRESAVPGETQPPVELRAVPPRDLADVADMAIAVQANLVQLAVAQARRLGSGRETGIRTPAPGAVRRFREILLDHGQIAAYDDLGLAMRLRECWGQHCVMCWLFSAADPQDPPDFRELQSTGPVRCPAAVASKCLEIENCLWRLRFELRLREQPELRRVPEFQEQYRAAQDIPVLIMGQRLELSSPENMLLVACEFAGMLAAVRWISDQRWEWGHPAIMDLPSPAPSPC
jgi:hypothetical protein